MADKAGLASLGRALGLKKAKHICTQLSVYVTYPASIELYTTNFAWHACVLQERTSAVCCDTAPALHVTGCVPQGIRMILAHGHFRPYLDLT